MAILRVGHVVVKMRDMEAAKQFYGDLLGMAVVSESPAGVFFRFNDYHHDIAVFKVSENAEAPKRDQVGLAHVALVIDSFASLQAMYRRLKERGVQIRATIDHGMTKSLYITDPDGNGIEIYAEVPEEDFLAPGYQGRNEALDLETVAAPV